MSWVAIETTDLDDAKVAALVEALRTKGLGTGQDDPVEELRENTIAFIRAEIASSQKWQLDVDAAKVPRDLKDLTCRMIVRKMMSRLQEPLGPDEVREEENDLAVLKAIREGKRAVAATETPLGTAEVQAGGGVEIVTKSEVLTSRTQMAGL